jgi:hypothetical protein
MTREEAYNQREENISYLRDTDWYVIRKSDTGDEIPVEVITKRAECRIKVSEAQDVLDENENEEL